MKPVKFIDAVNNSIKQWHGAYEEMYKRGIDLLNEKFCTKSVGDKLCVLQHNHVGSHRTWNGEVYHASGTLALSLEDRMLMSRKTAKELKKTVTSKANELRKTNLKNRKAK
jgi:hypothetical protein